MKKRSAQTCTNIQASREPFVFIRKLTNSLRIYTTQSEDLQSGSLRIPSGPSPGNTQNTTKSEKPHQTFTPPDHAKNKTFCGYESTFCVDSPEGPDTSTALEIIWFAMLPTACPALICALPLLCAAVPMYLLKDSIVSITDIWQNKHLMNCRTSVSMWIIKSNGGLLEPATDWRSVVWGSRLHSV